MAEARVDLVLGNSQFLQGISQADAAQKRFAGSWEASVGSIFRRSPFARAERALTDFAARLGGGDVTGAISGLLSRVTGFGLGTAVVLGTAALAAKKFRDEILESKNAVSAINNELATPLSVQGALGSGIGGVIDRDKKLLDDLVDKRNTIGGKISEMLEHPTGPNRVTEDQERQMLRFGFTPEDVKSMREDRRDPAVDSARKAQADIEERISKLVESRAKYEEDITNAKIRGLNGDKVGVAIEQNRLSGAQARAELARRLQSEQKLPGTHSVQDAYRQMGPLYNLERAQNRAAISEQAARGGADLQTPPEEFRKKMIGEELDRRAREWSAQGERRQLEFETRGRAMTPEEQSKHLAYDDLIGQQGLRERLEAARRGLIRQQSLQDSLVPENDRDRLSQYLGPIGEDKYRRRQNQLANIDAQLNGMKPGADDNSRGDQGVITAVEKLGEKMDQYWK
jgi:hypothetical protein